LLKKKTGAGSSVPNRGRRACIRVGPTQEDDTCPNRGHAYGNTIGPAVPCHAYVRTDGDHSAAVIINERSSMHGREVLPTTPPPPLQSNTAECSVDSLVGRGPEVHKKIRPASSFMAICIWYLRSTPLINFS